ncbi:hypothetical protein N7508_010284 [Penicillium antarcticum]|uniref:uncharacterized protein n=1 Tax=Penicillium antarcticum TaxID=416450 RepID=UPI00239D2819|nr:uncharacterized protein N7508_010284 [Penicillium antarcticum]KAJ5295463.1 hypothetical protein N7508_010284 [Penicillium antarcticum]
MSFAGAEVQFNQGKLQDFLCVELNAPVAGESAGVREDLNTKKDETSSDISQEGEPNAQALSRVAFHRSLDDSSKGLVHEYLKRTPQVPYATVIPWRVTEFDPFKRLARKGNGTWKMTRWPTALGRMRGVPIDAEIHVSMIRRMQADETYQSANATLRGGRDGLTKASPGHGIGQWKVCKYPDNPVRETYILAANSNR